LSRRNVLLSFTGIVILQAIPVVHGELDNVLLLQINLLIRLVLMYATVSQLYLRSVKYMTYLLSSCNNIDKAIKHLLLG